MHIYVDGPPEPTFTGFEVLEGRVQEISLHPDGTRLAYGLAAGTPELWVLDISQAIGERK